MRGSGRRSHHGPSLHLHPGTRALPSFRARRTVSCIGARSRPRHATSQCRRRSGTRSSSLRRRCWMRAAARSCRCTEIPTSPRRRLRSCRRRTVSLRRRKGAWPPAGARWSSSRCGSASTTAKQSGVDLTGGSNSKLISERTWGMLPACLLAAFASRPWVWEAWSSGWRSRQIPLKKEGTAQTWPQRS